MLDDEEALVLLIDGTAPQNMLLETLDRELLSDGTAPQNMLLEVSDRRFPLESPVARPDEERLDEAVPGTRFDTGALTTFMLLEASPLAETLLEDDPRKTFDETLMPEVELLVEDNNKLDGTLLKALLLTEAD
ncbi:uncharacterized protein BKCO1_900015 [Diplodia corticola]|uniref:Uncharacterized protein n=1 Tax=Diplodia corticola TaxID=236234 RepID=A0A1J9S8D4_9PEZI|nr:uncharacterized protein BKCO1_900015 [Diplodia corticola]OJD36767.1 hypothetical protein BKCO1_900015 [Diplodia corticola]